MTQITKQSIKKDAVTIKDGYWYYFDDEGLQIAVHGSAYSGKESVYCDQALVSEKRNLLSLTGRHEFEQNQIKYKVAIKVTNLILGRVECCLYKNDKLIDTQTKAIIKGPKSFFKIILGGFAVGVILGAVGFLLVHYIAKYFS